MQSITDKKADLRKQCKDLRLDMDEKERNIADRRIFVRTAELIDMLRPGQVFCYVSSPLLEVDTVRLLEYLISENTEVAVPRCTDSIGNMQFYSIKNTDCLSVGAYGISEPDVNICRKVFPDNRTLCIVPGLSFDECGRRMGFGKGYYDRFLKDFSGISVGLCYECCIMGEIPHEEHDAVMDYVITENRCFLIGDKKKVFSCE